MEAVKDASIYQVVANFSIYVNSLTPLQVNHGLLQTARPKSRTAYAIGNIYRGVDTEPLIDSSHKH